MALSAATIWEVRTAGNDTNGGGFVAGAAGTDYSQQDAKNTAGSDISTTDAVANGTTTITSATANFGTTIVGNIVYFAGGTGTITGVWRQVTARASTTSITIDAAIAASTGMTMNIGGALASPGQAMASLVAGHTVYVKAGTYTIASASTNIATGCLAPAVRVNIEGYNATRGDLGTAPLLQASGISTFTIVAAVNDAKFRNLRVDGAGLTSSRGFSTVRGQYYRLTALNCTNSGFSASAASQLVECRASGCSTAAAIIGYLSAYACVADANTVTGFAPGVSGVTDRCIAYGNTGASSDGFTLATGSGMRITNSVAYGNGRDGIRLSATSPTVINVMSESNTGAGVSMSGATSVSLYNAATFGNASGIDVTGAVGEVTNYNPVAGSGSFFTNAAAGDFALNATAGAGASARAAGVPGLFPAGLTTGYLDIGAAQHQDPAGGGGGMRLAGGGGLAAG